MYKNRSHYFKSFLCIPSFSAANNLIGELPEEIKLLEDTEELLLFGNKLKGIIPEGIASMKKLRNIDVERNQFSGQPLVKLYKLLNLRGVHLSDNQFDEQISGPGLANWQFVKEFWIGNNLFRGPVPEEIGKMESLGTAYSLLCFDEHKSYDFSY
jgi:hypothetical protein